MAMLSLLDVSHGFGGPPLLERVNLQVDAGERVCLLGRNGAGKSTLLQIVAGALVPDGGQVFHGPGVRRASLPQEVPGDLSGSVHELVAGGLRPNDDHHEEEWDRERRVEQLLEHLDLLPETPFGTLSGGLKRRVLLARALAGEPDLLLLDEPTNHLDLESILWLEELLLGSRVALFFVTHDRAFLRRVATRIVELDRGNLTNWNCDYDTYLRHKEEALQAEESQWAAQGRRLAQEEAWARRHPGAQRKRSRARLEALAALRAERSGRREQAGQVNLRLAEAERSGVKVIEAKGLGFGHPGGELLVRDLDLLLTRGDKVGLIGPNGVGKTTFLKLLLGELVPTAGTVKHGTRLEVAYFDQLRDQIDGDATVADQIADGSQTVTIDGRPRHVISYLQDFLFEPARARMPARELSGGERNRLLLARLFTRPANVLVMDEPTNDLDAETLDLLEDLLVAYRGTLLIVSHDRDFLDNVVTSTLVFEGGGRISEYVGGYSDWRREVERRAAAVVPAVREVAPAAVPAAAPGRRRKLSNKEVRELDELPGRIEALEREQTELTALLGDPAFYQEQAARLGEVQGRLAAIEAEHTAALARWLEIEEIANR